jgi:cytochrome P450
MDAFGQALSRWMIFQDPPDHTRLRSLVSRAFLPRAVEAMRPMVEAVVGELLDAVIDSGRMDVLHDLASPLPIIVIADMLGAAREDRDHFKKWSDDLAAFFGNTVMGRDRGTAAARSCREMTDHLRAVVAQRRLVPKDDVIGALIAAEERGSFLTEEELLATCVSLLFAGHETTTHLIGNGALALLRHPGAFGALQATPSLIDTALEELLRYDGPVQTLGRLATEDLEVGGKLVRKGQRLLLVFGSANRDPAQFASPDELDLARRENHHVGFGLGIHFCLGAPLARLEAQVALGTLVQRLPGLELATESLAWLETLAFPHGLKALPVSFRI